MKYVIDHHVSKPEIVKPHIIGFTINLKEKNVVIIYYSPVELTRIRYLFPITFTFVV